MSTDYKNLLVNSLEDTNLILVSNRGPYFFERNSANELVKKRGGGGLVSAFLSLLADIDLTWLAVAKTKEDAEIGLGGAGIGPRQCSAVKFLAVNKEVFSAYYNKMCNEVFWFSQHGLGDATYQPIFNNQIFDFWNAYKLVNQKLAEATRHCIRPKLSTIIMFQDYHLYLAAHYLKKNENIITTHFTHIPWPAPETMSFLPREILGQLLRGMLSNDLVGFHCLDYVQNFLNICDKFTEYNVDFKNQLVEYENRQVPIKAFPISIDAQSLVKEARTKKVMSFIRKRNSNRQIIFRADRLEPSKNIIRGFLSFERLLENNINFQKKVEFVAYLYESRNDLTYYRNYLSQVKATIERINKRFGTDDWQPIQMRLDDNYPQTLAAYKHFDVLLVNSIADGMNLVAKEGPLLNEVNGTIILSTKTGAYKELSHFCLSVNPFDIDETASAIKKALLMPKFERMAKDKLLKSTIVNNNSAKWLYYQVNTLKNAA